MMKPRNWWGLFAAGGGDKDKVTMVLALMEASISGSQLWIRLHLRSKDFALDCRYTNPKAEPRPLNLSCDQLKLLPFWAPEVRSSPLTSFGTRGATELEPSSCPETSGVHLQTKGFRDLLSQHGNNQRELANERKLTNTDLLVWMLILGNCYYPSLLGPYGNTLMMMEWKILCKDLAHT